MKKKHLFFFIIIGFLWACKDEKPQNVENSTPDPPKNIALKKTPVFLGDSAYFFVEKQVKFGTRIPGTPSHKACADYLVNTLEKYKFKTFRQPFDAKTFDGKTLKAENIIGSFNPDAKKRILLAAHWDTRPFNDKETKDTTKYKPIDGANDAGSGVGILLEIARVISQSPEKLNVGVDIIFFDAEDYGQTEGSKNQKADTWCLGSQYWAKNKRNAFTATDYSAYYGILLDMVGAKGAEFHFESYSLEYAKEITLKFWQIANQLGFKNFKQHEAGAITDDHYYVNTVAKIPMFDIIEHSTKKPDEFFGDYHHTSKDNMEIIDRKTLTSVGQSVLQMLYNED